MPHVSRDLCKKILGIMIASSTIILLLIYLNNVGFFTESNDSGIVIVGGQNVIYSNDGYGTWSIQMNDWKRTLYNVTLTVVFPRPMEIIGYSPTPQPEKAVPTGYAIEGSGLILEWNQLLRNSEILLEVALYGVTPTGDLSPRVEVAADKYGIVYHVL